MKLSGSSWRGLEDISAAFPAQLMPSCLQLEKAISYYLLIKMFEKRLRGYRAIGYARDEAPLRLRELENEAGVEYDDEALHGLDGDP